ncbi:MAG: lysine--tRNA ligase [Clostridia bacterium]|nr:lysine--tRNA ligase [Clostridia bacterium]
MAEQENLNVQQNQEKEVDALEVRKVRIEKLNDLVSRGKNPFEIVRFDRITTAGAIHANYEEFEGKEVAVAGRLMSKRIMGKASFGHIMDSDGKLQGYFSRDDLGVDEYQDFKKLDVGDIVGIVGTVFKTKTGETSVHAKKVVLLSKSLLPLPEKYHGLTNTELRYRQRYVDLIVNPDVKETFVKRSKIISTIRKVLDAKGFVEVETPVLNTLAGGANARPFVTHHNTLDIDMYLRIATELHLKRCIVGGFEKVYEIGRQFRNEGMDPKHNPEFTSIEIYQAYVDYKEMMNITEELYTAAAEEVCGSLDIVYQGQELHLQRPWARLTMVEAVKKYLGLDFDNEPLADLIGKANAKGLDLAPDTSWGNALYAVFDAFVEEQLVGPVFITDYPVEVSPLAKKKPTDNRLTERFEFFICASEGGNAFSELNDPLDQRKRFEAQMQAKAKGDEEAQPYDEDFCTALEYGMPPTGGLGIGIDRMVMFLTDSASIRDVLLFPTMRPNRTV